ncbi:hypothetical protein D1B31_14060 [Neobacillus notoginsengisoli]|uniref:Uncharacterized protein n=1 Tax=Neobacillus notoginsengisoli TaxID=1578198 RepID=A0A417YSU2_9BACI|nr:DUF6516 family protein [Neobacillus notoginsengisoli]RHW39078.1 hypothetical protein D1B31_14060 [Neobacillus notoginsengisoli]
MANNQRGKRKKQNLKLPLTNYEQIRSEFPFVLDIRDGDQSGMASSQSVIRKTILLDDGTKILATEHIKDEKIAWFYYDYIDSNGLTLVKFHSESHDDGKKESKKYQTRTEPYHIHPSELKSLSNLSRFPNFDHRSLRSVVESLLIYRLINESKKS